MLFSDESRDGIYRRLQKLFHHAYLDRIGTNPNAPLVYALGKRAAEALEVSRRKDVADPYIRHQLMVGNFRVAMTTATRERRISFLWRAVPADLPVKPDGFFSLQFPDRPDGRNRAHFFLEADRSTMTRERFVEKLRAYAVWHAAGGHTRSLGIRGFRVLTVTKSEERCASLLMAAGRADDLRSVLPSFWFGAEKRFSAGGAASVFEPIWQTPDESGQRKTILPVPV